MHLRLRKILVKEGESKYFWFQRARNAVTQSLVEYLQKCIAYNMYSKY